MKKTDLGVGEVILGGQIDQPVRSVSKTLNQTKRQKREADNVNRVEEIDESTLEGEESRRKAKVAKAREKKERKKAKTEKKAAKAEAKKARKHQETALVEDSKGGALEKDQSNPIQDREEVAEEDGSERDGNDIEPIEMDNGFAEEDPSPSPVTEISTFDASNQESGSSSISSIAPPPTDQNPSLPKIDTSDLIPTSMNTMTTSFPETVRPESKPEELKERLAARIEALRTARKASDPSRGPTNRQELIESRRRKEEERKAHKKELRRKAKEDEAAELSEALARGSPLLSNTNSPLLSPGSPAASTENNSFSFGRISFGNGQRATASLDAILTPRSKSKGLSDPRTALQAAEKRKSRLAALDPEKQVDISEKDVWLNAKKRAHGERVRDDTSLLKKTLKRKEKQKKKSEKEWTARMDGVQKSQAMKQKKREMNLQKRRDEKGTKSGKSKGKPMVKKKKARPGFEGSFKAKAPTAAVGAGGGGGGGRGDKPRRR